MVGLLSDRLRRRTEERHLLLRRYRHPGSKLYEYLTGQLFLLLWSAFCLTVCVDGQKNNTISSDIQDIRVGSLTSIDHWLYIRSYYPLSPSACTSKACLTSYWTDGRKALPQTNPFSLLLWTCSSEGYSCTLEANIAFSASMACSFCIARILEGSKRGLSSLRGSPMFKS